jgi:hypothetical protein
MPIKYREEYLGIYEPSERGGIRFLRGDPPPKYKEKWNLMTANETNDKAQSSTPPRTVRQLFLDNVRKSREAFDEANAIQASYLSNVGAHGGSEKLAFVACGQDYHWQIAVQEQQFRERLANMYGQVAVLNAVERLMLEQQNANQLMAYLIAAYTAETEGSALVANKTALNYLDALRASRAKNS